MSGALLVQVDHPAPMVLRGGFSCEPGQLVALVGPSGAGKTSLLRVIAGLMVPAQARIQCGNAVWCDTQAGQWMPTSRRHVGIVFQNYALMPHLDALDNVALALLDLPLAQRRDKASAQLARVGIDAVHQQRKPQQLSGGQQKLVALGRALMVGSKLLLLDEPFEGVAPALAQRLAEVISRLKDEGMAVIFSESDLQYSEHLVQKIYSIDRGAVTERALKLRL